MRIHRSHPDENFTIPPNATLQDDRLSCVALGILCQLISRPDGWNISADALWRQKKRHHGKKIGQGREAIRAAFVELEQYGYLVRHKTKGQGGQCITTLDLYDTPGHSEGEVEAQTAALPWDLVDEARRAAEERDEILNRGTESRASESRASDDRASANVASLQRTDNQRTELQSTEEKHSSTLAEARVAALAARRKSQLEDFYRVVNQLSEQDLRNALLKFERQRKRIYRDSRNAAIDQIKQDDSAALRGDTASREIDTLSYKYGLKHYYDEDREWPAFLVRPLLTDGCAA